MANVRRTKTRWLENLITRMSSIINEVAAIAQLLEYGVRLFSQIDLKADMIDNIRFLVRKTRDTSKNRNDSNKVDKGYSVFLVIDYTCLALLISAKVLLKMSDGSLVSEVACLPTLHLTIGSLEEATVTTNDFVF